MGSIVSTLRLVARGIYFFIRIIRQVRDPQTAQGLGEADIAVHGG